MANTDESSQQGDNQAQVVELIHNRRDAMVATVLTLLILGSTVRSVVIRTAHDPWLIRPPSSGLLRPLFIGFSFFFWAFVLWILFWFHRAARDRYQRLLISSFAIGFIVSIVQHFAPLPVRTALEPATVGAFLMSFVLALTLLA